MGCSRLWTQSAPGWAGHCRGAGSSATPLVAGSTDPSALASPGRRPTASWGTTRVPCRTASAPSASTQPTARPTAAWGEWPGGCLARELGSWPCSVSCPSPDRMAATRVPMRARTGQATPLSSRVGFLVTAGDSVTLRAMVLPSQVSPPAWVAGKPGTGSRAPLPCPAERPGAHVSPQRTNHGAAMSKEQGSVAGSPRPRALGGPGRGSHPAPCRLQPGAVQPEQARRGRGLLQQGPGAGP